MYIQKQNLYNKLKKTVIVKRPLKHTVTYKVKMK